MLPPNSTHLCQPLDVAYFRPLKTAWRCTLEDWKGRNKGCIPKHVFPRLLKKTLQSIKDTSESNMKAGFKAAGIYPLNRYAVLKRIPGENNVESKPNTNSSFSEELLTILKAERFGNTVERKIPRKHRLVAVQPGSSVSENQLDSIKHVMEIEGKENIARTIKQEPTEAEEKKRNLKVTKSKNGKKKGQVTKMSPKLKVRI